MDLFLESTRGTSWLIQVSIAALHLLAGKRVRCARRLPESLLRTGAIRLEPRSDRF
jgi:hypothetical protein